MRRRADEAAAQLRGRRARRGNTHRSRQQAAVSPWPGRQLRVSRAAAAAAAAAEPPLLRQPAHRQGLPSRCSVGPPRRSKCCSAWRSAFSLWLSPLAAQSPIWREGGWAAGRLGVGAGAQVGTAAPPCASRPREGVSCKHAGAWAHAQSRSTVQPAARAMPHRGTAHSEALAPAGALAHTSRLAVVVIDQVAQVDGKGAARRPHRVNRPVQLLQCVAIVPRCACGSGGMVMVAVGGRARGPRSGGRRAAEQLSAALVQLEHA